MNTRELLYFLTLVRVKSYTQTANLFKVSQPTITMAIKRLENEFNTNLLDRTGTNKSKIQLTKAGNLLAIRAQQIIDIIDLAHKEVNQADETKIKFGLPPIIGEIYFPNIIKQLNQFDLLSKLKTSEAGSQKLLEELKGGNINIALLGSSQPLTDPKINAIHLAVRPFSIIVSQDHPLAKQTTISFKDLKNEKFISLNGTFIHSKALKVYSQFAGFDPNIIYSSPEILLVKELIKQDIGIGFMVADAVKNDSQLVSIPLNDPITENFNVSIATRKDYPLTPDEQQLIDSLKTLETIFKND
ncbi:LysR family transcriptional regulator [Lentilactobacillus laojiaonis]|uniref:LysR family transcriptional regulator n=1 Tax=Lentilactobacillus laojiaonis TaxID=2883998 RepID=UPI001D0B9B78|nr:LysR family transcriptional regulator [Lentilactobacillus laojiaonis]UDM31883.1 LysR family transcriptional regulator [Lentilactobacillus laojiaonis]